MVPGRRRSSKGREGWRRGADGRDDADIAGRYPFIAAIVYVDMPMHKEIFHD